VIAKWGLKLEIVPVIGKLVDRHLVRLNSRERFPLQEHPCHKVHMRTRQYW